jgi:hypothetical protein
MPDFHVDDDYYSFHCHWNHCDFSFTSLVEFDNHLLFNHIPVVGGEQVVVPENNNNTGGGGGGGDGLKCLWDECGAETTTETELVNHVKQDHLPDTSKEHHQCLWVNENGSIPLSFCFIFSLIRSADSFLTSLSSRRITALFV